MVRSDKLPILLPNLKSNRLAHKLWEYLLYIPHPLNPPSPQREREGLVSRLNTLVVGFFSAGCLKLDSLFLRGKAPLGFL